MTDLAARLGADKGWTSRAVSSMEADGLLVRTGQDGDGRAVTVSLTRAGSARWTAMDVALTRHAADVMAQLPREDRAVIERALELLDDALASKSERNGRGSSPSAPRPRARAPVARSGRRP